jgi:hypothetical protein
MRVEFYLIDAMEVLHFAPVARALINMGVEVVFVSVRGDAHPRRSGWYDADAAEGLLNRLQLPFASVPNPNADIAVTTQSRYVLLGYRNLRARMHYAITLDSSQIPAPRSSYFAGFDLYLVHGPFDLSILTRYVAPDLVVIMGSPRFDAWFNRGLNHALPRRGKDISGPKPRILYLPTWSRGSSIDRFAQSVFALSERFEILVKPHHCTYRMEPERMERLNSGPVRMLSPHTLPEEAFSLGDIVISDMDSGSLCEAVLLNKHAVCLATSEQLGNLLLPEITRVLPICIEPGDLSQKVDKAEALDPLSESFQKLRRFLFDTTGGADAERAARAIVQFTEQSRPTRWSSMRRELRFRREYLSRENLRRHAGRIARRYGLMKEGA